MSKRDFAFGKGNFIIMAVAVLLIVIGFILMSGGSSVDGVSFNSEIFSSRRIVVAPVVALLGFILMVVAIVFKPRNKE